MKGTSLTEKTVLNREIESTMQAGENIQAHQVTDWAWHLKVVLHCK